MADSNDFANKGGGLILCMAKIKFEVSVKHSDFVYRVQTTGHGWSFNILSDSESS